MVLNSCARQETPAHAHMQGARTQQRLTSVQGSVLHKQHQLALAWG